MKKLINDPHDVVAETIAGFVAAHKDVVTSDGQFVERAEPKAQGKVGIISGGGSGHEPLHAGFVGYGMLDAAVPGPVFTSPTPDPIVAATKAADHGAGVLYIVKNYTGDVLNFDTAAELAEFDDIEVSQVIVNDDAAVEDSLYTAGRRGVAGTVLVEKIAGAAAERGDSLAEVAAVATEVVKNTRSMGVALTSCTVPHVGKPSFDLGDSEVEIGIGIHGEPGRRREPMNSADTITDQLLDPVVEDLGLCAGERVIALVNGMGGTPSSELYIVYRRVAERLGQLGVVVERSLVGNYVTSLDMQGASVTLMRVSDELLELFDAPVNTVALRKGM
ncbi:dihydroxyacetone kinase subunit DhaK [Corynebacterium diphtheriae]|uniref:phosphoenolpyruvate--glycerone phosphotransferase n=1 Tax=Corynebacterium diphtheriae bv. gravis TaxID=1720349 RepID=A0AAX0J0A9_CORDP|nr:dihydroxyacetone kinase subunit DhaK [Corynebacterium diphtheriae]ERA48647.1 putative dihydroxyacetone kinase sununit [Corynebacterium diphtheriae DSM 43988]AEX68492.1 putative dihydroxyacetone kinase sununit [Corynebacterium diphtheriae C7 (beta)]OKY21939.1 dihydroxyacetone kinase [Corynebacterium diphtheriae bv. gravis]UEB34743.1 dihydroxyacetone kinase subunit DhaK [Corynebacterium diphtheriae subsp. diphtheriae]UEB40880.1 dihydroxyacetone kinase subunit DhaK [Corynebacterium diphtheriae